VRHESADWPIHTRDTVQWVLSTHARAHPLRCSTKMHICPGVRSDVHFHGCLPDVVWGGREAVLYVVVPNLVLTTNP